MIKSYVIIWISLTGEEWWSEYIKIETNTIAGNKKTAAIAEIDFLQK